METLKQSWLTGQIGVSPVSMHGPINELARPLFKYWTEKEMRNCWRDFKKMWNEFIKRNSENAHSQRNLSIFIVKDLFMLDGLQAFMDKWSDDFKKIVPPRIIHPYKPNKFISENTITIEYILGALFILDHASRNEFGVVLDMYSLLSDEQLHSIKIVLTKEYAVKENAINAARSKEKDPITKLAIVILKENINKHFNSILHRLQNQTNEDKNICVITSIEETGQDRKIYFKSPNSKKIDDVKVRNFKSTVSKIRKEIKNKLP